MESLQVVMGNVHISIEERSSESAVIKITSISPRKKVQILDAQDVKQTEKRRVLIVHSL